MLAFLSYFVLRIDFNSTVKSKLENTLPQLLNSIYDYDWDRQDELEFGDNERDRSWAVKPDPESVASIALRKTDLKNFMINNEGNLYNNLFFKVKEFDFMEFSL